VITDLLNQLSEASSIDDFPAYTKDGSWVCCSHWSNGYAVGTLLISHHLQGKKLPSIRKYLDLLATHFKSPKFQDIGYLFQSSAVLYDELSANK